MHNLGSQTYDVFERDPVKYRMYEDAISAAIQERFLADLEACDGSLVVVVVGAGRGPLVSAALRAARAHKLDAVQVFAVEKNPNAIVTLSNMQREFWGDKVTVVHGYVRQP